MQALLEDAREFLASEAWYTERGIPYRRGYLLHGVPGGGRVAQFDCSPALIQRLVTILMSASFVKNLPTIAVCSLFNKF